jgi:hypothetical protein
MKAMARFTGTVEQHIGFLQQRAGHIEDYLHQR